MKDRFKKSSREAPLLPHKQQAPQPSKDDLRAQAAAAVAAWVERNGRPPAGRKTTRTMTAVRSPLAEPIIVAEWKRGRSGDVVRVILKNYEGYDILDVRSWFSDAGYRKPGKGFSISVRHLGRLADAINQAKNRALALGLLPNESEPAA